MKSIKKNLLMILITILISLVAYINFFPEYYSIDTTKIIKDGYMSYGMQYSLQDARIFAFLIFYVAEIINISLKSLWQILLISAIFISSVSVLKIYNIILNIKPVTNKKTHILIYIIAYCYIFNFMYIDAMSFAENWIIAFSILFYIKSAEEIILNNNKLKGLLFFIIGILFYQGTLNLFVSTVALFLIINKKEDKKKIIKKLFITGIITVSVVGIDFLIIKLIKKNMTVVQADRLGWNLIENLGIIKANIPNLIINSVNLFPKYVHIVLILVSLIIIFIKIVKEKEILKTIIPIGFTLICYISTIGLSILTPTMLTASNGRMFTSIGIIISALLIYMYVQTNLLDSKKIGKAARVLIVIYFIINIWNTINVTGMLKEGNNIDREISYEIQNEIKKYENETGKKIKSLAVMYRVNMGKERKWIRSKKMLWAYNALVYETYTGERIEDTTFEKEIIVNYFMEIKKTIKCIDETVYVYM